MILASVCCASAKKEARASEAQVYLYYKRKWVGKEKCKQKKKDIISLS